MKAPTWRRSLVVAYSREGDLSKPCLAFEFIFEFSDFWSCAQTLSPGRWGLPDSGTHFLSGLLGPGLSLSLSSGALACMCPSRVDSEAPPTAAPPLGNLALCRNGQRELSQEVAKSTGSGARLPGCRDSVSLSVRCG